VTLATEGGAQAIVLELSIYTERARERREGRGMCAELIYTLPWQQTQYNGNLREGEENKGGNTDRSTIYEVPSTCTVFTQFIRRGWSYSSRLPWKPAPSFSFAFTRTIVAYARVHVTQQPRQRRKHVKRRGWRDVQNIYYPLLLLVG